MDECTLKPEASMRLVTYLYLNIMLDCPVLVGMIVRDQLDKSLMTRTLC